MLARVQSTGADGTTASACVDALYVHVPFCMHRCHYCDFFTLAGKEDARSAYVDALLAEASVTIKAMQFTPSPTVFIGGGTPTYLEPADLDRLLGGLAEALPVPPGEWTVEANPETVTAQVAAVLAGHPVSRVSLGMQSAQPHLLKALERQHDPAAVPRTVDHIRSAGIDDVSLDLIFGIPGQQVPDVHADLAAALALDPVHLSVYGLIYEPGTPLRRRRDTGKVTPVDEDAEVDMFTSVQQLLAEAGFEHYEISNWAKPGHRCQHNEIYWTNGNWWPLGPSAAGHVSGTRWRTIPRLKAWMDQRTDGLPPVVDLESLDADAVMGEVLMLGLRRLAGVPNDTVAAACSTPKRGAHRAAAIATHTAAGLLHDVDGHLALTRSGLLLADHVISDLL